MTILNVYWDYIISNQVIRKSNHQKLQNCSKLKLKTLKVKEMKRKGRHQARTGHEADRRSASFDVRGWNSLGHHDFSVLIVCSYLLDVFLHSSLLLGWSSFSEILVIEGMVRKIVAENSFHGSSCSDTGLWTELFWLIRDGQIGSEAVLEIERTIGEGYFEGSDQKITISNILSLSFGLIGLFLIVHGLIRKKLNLLLIFIFEITIDYAPYWIFKKRLYQFRSLQTYHVCFNVFQLWFHGGFAGKNITFKQNEYQNLWRVHPYDIRGKSFLIRIWLFCKRYKTLFYPSLANAGWLRPVLLYRIAYTGKNV